MCNKSETISKIAVAMVKFSEEVRPIDKDGTNPHFRSAYTTLDHMIDSTKPILTKYGLTVMQFPGGDGQKITVRTMIIHESGEWIETEPLTLQAVKTDPQGAGSAITYARRYSYAAALSLSLGDDDDGNSSSQPPQGSYNRYPSQTAQTTNQQTQQRTEQSQQSSAAISQAQIGYIKKIINEKNISDDEYRRIITNGYGVQSSKDLTKSQASKLINELNEYVPEVEQELPF